MTINQEIVLAVQLSTDGKGFKRVGTAHTPWDSTSDFLTNTPVTRRHEGMLGYIRGGSNIDIWHFVGGIADEDFVKYALDSIESIIQVNTTDDRPTIGDDKVLYIVKATWTPYVWDGSAYQVVGNPGPTGAKGNKGDKGDPNSLSIGTVTSGETASATITGYAPTQILNLVLPKGDTGDKGNDGDSGITVRTNGTENGVQNVLDLIDSDTIGITYIGTGQVKLYTKSPVLFNGKAGTSEAIAAGVIVGATNYTNSKLAGRESEVFRSGVLISDFDQGGGVEYAIKDTDGTLDSTTINFLSEIQDGEWIKIKLV